MTHARPPRGTGAAVTNRPASLDTHGTAPGQLVPAKLTPEFAYVGAVLSVNLPTAHVALGHVVDGDVADHRLRTVLAVARRLVADGVRPDPVLVLERARDDGDVTTAAGLGELSMCLLTLVDNVPVPASWPHYAQGTLIAALRRRIAEAGARLTQAAETESLDSLIALVDRETTAVRELAARREPTPTPLRAVP